MLIIVGFIVVILSVLGGYVASHGKIGALWQPFELVIIGGAAFGAFLAGTPVKTVKQTFAAVIGVTSPPALNRLMLVSSRHSEKLVCITRPSGRRNWPAALT